MLYDPTVSPLFPKLTAALRGLGASEEALAVLTEYLDTDKPRNDALLDRLTPMRSAQTKDYVPHALHYALRDEIENKKNAELFKRWYLYSYALYGEYCGEIGFFAGRNQDWSIWKENVAESFRSRYGEEGDARRCTIFAASWRDVQAFTPEVCADAMRFTRDTAGLLTLCMTILDKSEPEPPKKGLKAILTKNTPPVQAALDRLESLYQGWNAKSELTGSLLLAMAEAAYFSEVWHKRFIERMSQQPAYSPKADHLALAALAVRTPVNTARIVQMLADIPCNAEYIANLAMTMDEEAPQAAAHSGVVRGRDAQLRLLAERYPEPFAEAMRQFPDYEMELGYTDQNKQEFPARVRKMEKILHELHPEITFGTELIDRAQRETAIGVCRGNQENGKTLVRFLGGSTGFDTVVPVIPSLTRNHYHYNIVHYIAGYGLDEFAQRCICLQAVIQPGHSYAMRDVPGYRVSGHQAEFIDILHRHGVPMCYILNFCGNLDPELTVIDKEKGIYQNTLLQALLPYKDEVAAFDQKLTVPEGRILAMRVLHEAGDTAALFGYAGDSSKAVRAVLTDLLPAPGGEWDADILRLLNEKKQAYRETAVALLEKNCPENLRGDVEAALSREKNAGLQTRLAAILGDASAGTAVAAAAQADVVKSLTKGSKAKKMDWLFQTEFSPVCREDGSPADEMLLRALCLCYAEQFPLGRSSVADQLAATLRTGDLERFAQEVFARWIALSAPAKTKWVLYLTAIHGGIPAIDAFKHYIPEWAGSGRSAIASEAVMALALNGSSPALMAVDGFARKSKSYKVGASARDALKSAASALNITPDELADRIVPDLGFDEKCCRVFDFGTRQFQVFLTPDRELEIFEGDKKLKNLPKPGAKDDPERSAAAYKDFKEMKKLMKAALDLQQKRLEDALKRSRRWNTADWQALFIRKPIMHSFAIGLIWGIYGDSGLTATFRYMEDGTFTTADEEEFELPESAQIGLVHPIELDDAARDAWQEQLSDYEITQPFPQIERPVYRVEEAEREQTQLMRFHGKTINGGTLMGRMERMNWHKGGAQDGGHFYEFLRLDITGSEQQENGRWLDLGYRTELHFSGMYIGAYASQEDVTVESVEFYTPTGRQPLKLGEIDPQYFSEILCQVEQMLSLKAKKE